MRTPGATDARPDPAPLLSGLVEGLVEGRRGACVHRKRDRSVHRVEAGERVLFVKRGTGPKAREVRREAGMHAVMEEAGLPVASLVAHGDHDGAAWLVTEEAPGRPLGEVVAAASRAGTPGRARRALAAVADVARRMHGLGFALPDLTAPHLFVDETGAPPRVRLIDVARAERVRGAGAVDRPLRSRDLAALIFSLPRSALTRADRVRLIRGATDARGPDLRALCDGVDGGLRRLRLRTRWRHGYVDAEPCFVAEIERMRGGPGQDLFGAVVDPDGWTVIRTLSDRENRSLGTGADGRPAWFAKVYPPVRRGLSPAMREREAIDLLARRGVPVCAEAAYGEDVERGSFLVVRTCPGVPLDDLLRAGVTAAERRFLVGETARIFRRMHGAGLRHRDAYACHLFAARTGDGNRPFELRLIDLTRAGRAPFPQGRWFVKDVAQLWHGALGADLPTAPVRRTDAVRWLRTYLGLPRLDAAARRFARRVVAKEARIRARGRRKQEARR